MSAVFDKILLSAVSHLNGNDLFFILLVLFILCACILGTILLIEPRFFSRTPSEKLIRAAEKGNLKRIKKLLEGKSWPDRSPDEVCKSFKEAMHKLANTRLSEWKPFGSDRKTIEPEDIYCAYQDAAHNGHVEILQYFVTFNIQLDFAFIYAAQTKHVEFLRHLIQSGASKEEALLCSAAGSVYDIVRDLVESGANVNAEDPENGYSVLMYAACNYEAQAPETIEYLIGKGADIHVKDNQGDTVLHIMAENACADYCLSKYHDEIREYSVKNWRVLEKYITDLNPLNNEGKTPLDYAYGHDNALVDIWIPLGAKRSRELK